MGKPCVYCLFANSGLETSDGVPAFPEHWMSPFVGDRQYFYQITSNPVMLAESCRF